MEEILASIRRIIADDQESIQESSRAEQINDISPLRNVLDLAGRHVPAMAEYERDEADTKPQVADWQDERFTPDFASIYGSDIGNPALSPAKGQAPGHSVDPSKPEGLLSKEADASVSNAFNRLAASMVPSNPKTMEDIVKEMLRPMLKAWLDDNLPPLVERLVQAEIERLSRSGR